MRKVNIVSLLVAAVLAPLAAQADVTLYGKVYAEMGVETFGSGTTESEYSTLDDAQDLGRLGVKFSQDLAGGQRVFGQYEFSLNAPDSTNDFVMREAYVGIGGEFVSFAMGRFDGAYKTTGGVNWDPFAYTSLQLAGNGGQSGTNFGNQGYIDHAMQFQAKYAEGDVRFDATLQYGADATPSATLPPTPKDSFLAGIDIGFGSLDIIYAFAHNAGTGATNQKFGTKVSAGDASFMIQAENVDQGGYDPISGEGQFMTGIVTYAVGNWLWVVEIAEYNTDYTDLAALPVPITGANSSLFTFGGRYYLAKNAWLVFGVRNTDSENDAADGSATVGGIRFDF